MKSRIVPILAIVAFLCCGITQAQVPRKLNYQGYLTTPTGAPVNTPQTLVARIYDASSGGNLLFTETHNPVTVSNGIFNILLGSVDVNTSPLDLKFLAQYYLGITVGTDPEMSPRQPLAASPYAIRAATADSAEALRIGGTIGEVLAGTGAAPAWTSVPTIAGNVVIGATTTQPFPSRLQVVAPTTKTNATLGVRGLSVTSNEASAPFALDVKIFGAPLLANRGVILQSTDWNTGDGGNLLLQPQGGNVGVGLGLYTPGSTLTVAGRIESTSSGFKFPDGTTQTTAASGSGTLAGDVTGPQATTLVALVGGVTAANVAAGANLANAATNVNTANTIVRRDGSGNFAAGTITAAGDLNLSATNASGSVGVINLGTSRVHSFGSANVFAGTGAGNFTMTGGNNTGIGNATLAASTGGGQNTATGSIALAANTAGGQNTASGYAAMQVNQSGGNNSALGANALSALVSGNFNTATGAAALANLGGSSSNNVGIGYAAGSNLTLGNGNIYLGNPGVTTESNMIRIGDSSLQTKAFIAGIRSVTPGVNDASLVVIDSNGQLGTTSTLPLAAKAKNTLVVSATGGDFTTISAALTSMTDNTASNRYVIYVGPGTYTEQVTMKPYVDIQGAGELATKITFTGFPGVSSGTVLGASNAELRFLTVECIGGSNAIAVYNNGVSPRLNHVTAIASGGGGKFGIFNQTNAAPTISNSTITSAGVAISNNGSGNSVRISNSQLSGVLPYLLINGTASTLNIATSQLSGGGGIFNTGTLACVASYGATYAALNASCV